MFINLLNSTTSGTCKFFCKNRKKKFSFVFLKCVFFCRVSKKIDFIKSKSKSKKIDFIKSNSIQSIQIDFLDVQNDPNFSRKIDLN